MQATTIGLEMAKQVFFVVGADRQGRQVWRKRLRRGQVGEFFAQQAPCLVGLEACGGAQYWARQLQAQGHAVKVMAPRHVRAFRRGQKNDYNDAGAIGEAARQPAVRGVALKSAAQQDVQALHRVRDGLVRQRTAVVNRVRGLLAEQGIVLAAGIGRFRRLVPRQHTTGGKPRLYGITKRGDKRLRAVLIHGARAVVRHAARKADPLSRWIRAVQARRGTNVATVALANKLVRIAWVVLARGEPYVPARAAA